MIYFDEYCEIDSYKATIAVQDAKGVIFLSIVKRNGHLAHMGDTLNVNWQNLESVESLVRGGPWDSVYADRHDMTSISGTYYIFPNYHTYLHSIRIDNNNAFTGIKNHYLFMNNDWYAVDESGHHDVIKLERALGLQSRDAELE